jgi:hypothetical protein
MQTCPHCLSTDIPDQATHCRHCTRRIKSLWPAVLVAAFMIIVLVVAWFAVSVYQKHQDALAKARSEIDLVKTWCMPETSDELVDQASRQFERMVGNLPLEPDEQYSLENVFANELEVRGCGTSAKAQKQIAQRRESVRHSQAVRPRQLSEQVRKPESGPAPIEMTFRTYPNGANIYIDDDLVCESPCRYQLDPGAHKLNIIKVGYAWISDSFQADRPREISYDLERTLP